MKKYTLELIHKFVSPLHFTHPDGSWYVQPGDNYGTTTKTPFPLSRTVRMRCANPLLEAEHPFLVHGLPVMPANSIGGAMRRCSSLEVFDAILAKGEQISLEAYHCLVCGSRSVEPEQLTDVAEAIAAEQHPFLGVWGGGPRMVRSSRMLNTAWPITHETLERNLVPDLPHTRERAVASGPMAPLTQIWYESRKPDGMMFTDPSAPVVVANYAASVTAAFQVIEDRKTSNADEETKEADKKKPSMQGAYAYEFVVPGVSFYSVGHILTDGVGEAGLGLFLATLLRYAARGQIGGLKNKGFGRFELEARMTPPDGGQTVSVLDRAPNGNWVPANVPWVTAAIAAWGDAAEKMTAAELEALFAAKPKPAKKAKKAKKQEQAPEAAEQGKGE